MDYDYTEVCAKIQNMQPFDEIWKKKKEKQNFRMHSLNLCCATREKSCWFDSIPWIMGCYTAPQINMYVCCYHCCSIWIKHGLEMHSDWFYWKICCSRLGGCVLVSVVGCWFFFVSSHCSPSCRTLLLLCAIVLINKYFRMGIRLLLIPD